MEVNKIVCVENPPFESNNMFINFNVRPSACDWNSSYINIPATINETYELDFNPNINLNGAVANVSLTTEPISLGSRFFKSAKLTADSRELLYVLYPNILNANLDLYTYNSDQLPLQEFLSGNKLTKSSGKSVLSYSQFRELFNKGNVKSNRFVTNIRVPLKDILGDFCAVPRDFMKYSEVILTLELDEMTYTLSESNPQFYYSVDDTSVTCTRNVFRLSDLNIVANEPQLLCNVDGASPTVLTFQGGSIPVSQLYFGISDTINVTNNGTTQGLTIESVDLDANGEAEGYTIEAGATALVAGDATIETSSVPVYKAISTANNAYENLYKNNIKVGSNIAIVIDDDGVITAGLQDSEINNIIQVNDNTQVIFLDSEPSTGNPPLDGQPSGTLTNALYLTPLDAAGTINRNTLINSLNNYDESDFACWTGQACVLLGNGGIENTYALINEIQYIEDPEHDELMLPQVSLSQPLVFTGACDSLCLLNIKASELKLNLNNKLELVQYKYSKPLYDNIITKQPSFFQTGYRKWVYDGATAPIIAPRGTYEHTFNLESYTYLCAIVINSGDSLLSDVTGLDSYRILLDGVATVSRKIVFNQRSTMTMERLLTGLDYLGDVVNTISIDPTKNLMAENYPYIIFQDIPVDGAPHKLVLSITNGNVATDATKNIRLFKVVFDKM